MNQLDLFLPFSLPPQEMARDLLRELKMPALSMLLTRARRVSHDVHEDFSRALPHEIWLTRQFGIQADQRNSSPALTARLMNNLGLDSNDGTWFIVQPIHLHIALDHIVLTEPRQLQLSEQDARALFELAKPLVEETGGALLYGDAATWFLRSDGWSELLTSTPDAASGHNIDIWMPKGPHERDWRRLQNEIQMNWHAHAINDQREMHGLKSINSLWLWGGAAADAGTNRTSAVDQTFVLPESTYPFNALAAKRTIVSAANEALAADASHGLAMLDTLIEPMLANDWGRWLAAFQQLESNWFAPLLDAVGNGRLSQLTITLSDNTTCSTYAVDKSALQHFWRRSYWQKPSLSRLAQ